MHVTLCNGDGAVPRDPRQREHVDAGLGELREGRMPEHIGLECLSLLSTSLFCFGIRPLNCLRVLVLGRVFVEMPLA
jgi:hypothetical protein